MANERHASAKLPLGEFLAALSQRWQGLSREELLAVLVAHAERLPMRDRQAFLEVFPCPGTGPAERVASARASLLDDIEAFAGRVSAGEYADDEGYYRDRDGWADEEAAAWAPEADNLFAAIGDVFVAGELDTAREAYEALLAPFGPSADDAWQLELWRLEDTDVPEALARYLRCVYETTPTDARPATFHCAYVDLPWSHSAPTLAEVAGTRREPLPDPDACLPAWIERLLAGTDRPPSQQRVRLLAEAATMDSGVEGLADLTRRPGPHQGAIGLAWVDALAEAGHLADAATAARETFDLPDTGASHRAGAADRLADLTDRLGDNASAVAARRWAWTAEPTRRRLLALAASSHVAGVMAETLAREADNLLTTCEATTDRLGCELLLLSGRLAPAIAALTGSEPLGWHRASHPGPVVLPFLWAAATGTAPTADSGHLGKAFTAIDGDPDALPRFEDWPTPDGGRATGADRPEPAAPSLSGLLGDVIRRLPPDATQRERWMTTATAVVDARVNAIVSGKHRGAYARAASLAFAHAESLAALDRQADAHAYLAGIRARYPRHVAFRGELDTAAGASTILVRRAAPTRR
jgi:hypothetical protein